jgi:hypothetical protein
MTNAIANAAPGSFSVTASTGFISTAFELSASVDTPALVEAFSGSPQSAAAGMPFRAALTAKVTDAGGLPVAGITVTFTTPASGASAALSSATAVTNSVGEAHVLATANSIAGSYSATAAIDGVAPATFSLTNLQPAGVALAVDPPAPALGSPVAMTVTITPPTSTGSVTLYDGVTPLATQPLSSGTALFSTPLLPAGRHRLWARYSGDELNPASASSEVQLTVTAIGADTYSAYADVVGPSYGNNYRSLAVADFNADGKPDLAMGSNGYASIKIMLGKGDGTFEPPGASVAQGYSQELAAGDFDSDGKTHSVLSRM